MNIKMLKSVSEIPQSLNSPLYQVAISQFVANDLDQLDITYLRRNVCPARPEQFNAMPLGHKIYIYGGPKSGVREKFYGLNYLPEIKAQPLS